MQSREIEINISDILVQLKKNILLMIGVAVIAAVIAFSYSMLNVSTTYSARVDALIKDHMTEYDINSSRAFAKSLKEVMETEEMQHKILEAANMEEYGAEYLSKAVSFEMESSTSVLSVNISSDDRDVCKKLSKAYSNALYDAYVTYIKSGHIEVLSSGEDISEYTENNTVKYTATAFLLGLFLVAAVVVMLKMFNYSVQDEDEFLRSGEILLLGTVSNEKVKKSKLCDLGFVKRKSNASYEISKADIIDVTSEKTGAEYVSILNGINLQKDPSDSKIIVVSSDDFNRAKSVVSLNMAITAAHEGKSVLIIDADAEKSGIANVVGSNKKSKPYNIGVSKKTVSEHITHSHTNGMDILVLSSNAGRMSKVTKSTALQAMLSDLSASYDMVFINAPHIGGAENQALILAEKSAGIVMIANINQTLYDSLAYAKKKIENTNVKLLGAVLTDI